MGKRAVLVLSDGSVYEGRSFGADVDVCGEVVFNTSMTGYQEMLTDPACAGQIVVATYPLIGNYGINAEDAESERIQVRGLAVREEAAVPSHHLCSKTIGQYFSEVGIPGIAGIDTRSVARKLRSQGTMMGILTSKMTPLQALEVLAASPHYSGIDFVKDVSTGTICRHRDSNAPGRSHIVILDCGCPYSIIHRLRTINCDITAVPCTSSAWDILELKPDGVLISPGPGNPEVLDHIVNNIKGLIGRTPIMGLCLGGQLVARAFGGKNRKLGFGHRGSNHPVRELRTGLVYITSQNHGYATDPASLPPELEISHVSLNDGTIEGLRHKSLPIFTTQYHAEASPGQRSSAFLFEEFLKMIRGGG